MAFNNLVTLPSPAKDKTDSQTGSESRQNHAR